MRERLLAFVHALRSRDVRISVAESLDALAAVAVAGVERGMLREALAATLVKDERDRPAFDPLFDAHFPLAGPAAGRGRKTARAGASDGGSGGGGSAGGTAGGSAAGPAGATTRSDAATGNETAARAGTGARSDRDARGDTKTPETPRRGAAAPQPPNPRRDAGGGHGAAADPLAVDRRRPNGSPRVIDRRGNGAGDDASAEERRGRAARQGELLVRPFEQFTSRDVEEARGVVRELAVRLRARLARRERAARRGRIDLRRTLRAATASGGVPVRLERRSRRPGRPDLVVLCDLSGSVATASELCLGLIAPAGRHFRRVHLFAYVDRLCPISIEQGHVAPGGALDLHARSDFGRVLVDLWAARADVLGRSTLLLVLGDARNNRRPPRADLLRAARERVGRVVWLVPERRERWNTGDSVLDRYAPVCDAVVECTNLATLAAAVRHLF